MFVNPFSAGISLLSLFVNSFFESTSGFTTTGVSMIAHPEDLPQSFAFYRSYTHWVGGLSLIYLIMAIFYPEKRLRAMKGILGAGEKEEGMLNYKQLIVTIVVIFTVYTAALFLMLLLLGLQNPIYDIALIFSAITSGGFIPDSQILSLDQNVPYLMTLMAAMIISALPFAFHYSIFSGRMRAKNVGVEVMFYAGLLVFSAFAFAVMSGLDIVSASFHTVSASTNTGFQFVNVASLTVPSKIFLMVIMLIGGTAFSLSGGIKVGRVLFLVQKMDKWRKYEIDTPASVSSVFGRTVSYEYAIDYKLTKQSAKLFKEAIIVVLLFPTIAVIGGVIIAQLNNTEMLDSIFASTSALTNTGISVGLITVESDLISKVILVANMIVGRFEIITVLFIFVASLRKI